MECKVEDADGNNPVYLFQTFNQSTCIDKSRLGVEQTSFAPIFQFNFRSFRYQGDIKAKE